jgi:hypothetical protein
VSETKTVKLINCGIAGVGTSGDVVTIDASHADHLIASGNAVLVEPEKPKEAVPEEIQPVPDPPRKGGRRR